jgi:hypothetical protein
VERLAPSLAAHTNWRRFGRRHRVTGGFPGAGRHQRAGFWSDWAARLVVGIGVVPSRLLCPCRGNRRDRWLVAIKGSADTEPIQIASDVMLQVRTTSRAGLPSGFPEVLTQSVDGISGVQTGPASSKGNPLASLGQAGPSTWRTRPISRPIAPHRGRPAAVGLDAGWTWESNRSPAGFHPGYRA